MGMNLIKVVMAVDPLEDEFKPNKASLTELRTWLKKNTADLEMVHVMMLDASKEEASREISERELLVKHYADELGFIGEVPTQVLLEPSGSNRKVVNALISYVERTSAVLLVLTSSGRRLIGRLLMGSFADAVVAHSSVPVLFLGSAPQPHSWANSVLFPTDFSPASRKAFEIFLTQFKNVRPEIVLFHMSSLPYYWYAPFSMPPFSIGRLMQKQSSNGVNEVDLSDFD